MTPIYLQSTPHGDAVRALLAVEWTPMPAIFVDPSQKTTQLKEACYACNKMRTNGHPGDAMRDLHWDRCPLDAALVANDLPDAASREEARQLIAQQAVIAQEASR